MFAAFIRHRPIATVSMGSALLGATGLAYYAHLASVKAAAPNIALTNDFRPFELVDVQFVSHNTHKYRFALPVGKVLGLNVASAVLVKADIDGKEVIRPYTPTSPSHNLEFFDLVVKTYPEGVMSKHIASLQPGDTLLLKGPIPKIRITTNMKKHIGMIAGGTGITPMFQVIQELLDDPSDNTELTLIFANVSEEDILLKEKLNNLANKHHRFKVHYVVEKPPKGWTGSVGYVTKDIIKKYIPAPSKDSIVLVCGPPPMMNAISGNKAPDFSQGPLKGILKELGYNEDNVFKF